MILINDYEVSFLHHLNVITTFIFFSGYLSNSSSGGYAEFSIQFNAPPTSGSCSVTPIDGYALQTDFTVACQGFTDVDDPLTYEMLIYSSVAVVDGAFVGLGEGIL